MSLYNEWDKIAYQIEDEAEYERFWGDYLPKETGFYVHLLENHAEILEASVQTLADQFSVDVLTAIGFLDGINTSLKTPIEMEALTQDSVTRLDVDYEKLFYNMHEAKAEWLYTLPQWDQVLTQEKRKEIKKAYNHSKIYVKEQSVGRNDPCPCGSGKKFKKCCGLAQ